MDHGSSPRSLHHSRSKPLIPMMTLNQLNRNVDSIQKPWGLVFIKNWNLPFEETRIPSHETDIDNSNMPSSRSPRNQQCFSVSSQFLHSWPQQNPLTFTQFMSLLDEQDRYEQAAANLFGRNDLLLGLSMITHIWKTIDSLKREMHRQWQMAEDVYGRMERHGLEDELGEEFMQIPLRSSYSPSVNDDPLPLYWQTPPHSSTPSVCHRRPTPATTVVFPDFPPGTPTPQRPPQSRLPTPFHSSPIETWENPILVEADNNDTMYFNVCRTWGHEWIYCHEYQCEHCQIHGLGHTLSDCFYHWSWDL